jgi:hypothetical protein
MGPLTVIERTSNSSFSLATADVSSLNILGRCCCLSDLDRLCHHSM